MKVWHLAAITALILVVVVLATGCARRSYYLVYTHPIVGNHRDTGQPWLVQKIYEKEVSTAIWKTDVNPHWRPAFKVVAP